MKGRIDRRVGDLKEMSAMLPFWARLWMVLGCVAGGTAVAMAAVSAHALPQRLTPRALAGVQGAVQMQGWHALALVLVGLWALRAGPRAAAVGNVAGACFAVGVLLFCGSVYLGDLAGVRLGPTAPAGGVLLMVGWVLLGASVLLA
jgi:uncharacterized membrane protein YgdD (TMEM256/DUF423 family)